MQLILALLHLVALPLAAAARKQWYYTGRLTHNDVRDPNFEGSVSALWPVTSSPFRDSSEEDMEPIPTELTLMYGGMVANFSHYNSTIVVHYTTYMNALIGDSRDVSIRGAWIHTLYTTRDYENPLFFEIGLYDHDLRQYVEHSNMPAKAGQVAVLSADEFDASSGRCRAHCVVLSADTRLNISPLQHAWRDSMGHSSAEQCSAVSAALVQSLNATAQSGSDPAEQRQPSQPDAAGAGATEVAISVMTYNLWHTNPAAWLYNNPASRWIRYWKRIRLFVNTILNDDPDVIMLQEVRFDAAFSAARLRGFLEDAENGLDVHEKRCVVTGSQVEQVRCMLELMSARRRAQTAPPAGKGGRTDTCVVAADGELACEDDSSSVLPPADNLDVGNTYQFAYQPAMSMYNSQYPWVRGEEEGVAVLLRARAADGRSAQRLARTECLLLPRTLDDPGDDHQRALIHVEIELTSPGIEHPLVYDVYTSHLSLSEAARNRSYALIRSYMNSGRGAFQFFGGDLNAEPQEGGIVELSNPALWAGEPALVDLWETQARDRGEVDLSKGYTFPTCKPVKRIDYIFFRNRGGDRRVGIPRVEVRIVGRDASEDSAHLVNSRPDMGMMDMDSPLWASDHMALVADVSIVF